LSTFAFFVKNVIRQRALQRIAGQVNLLGTGMALPWSIFSHAELATSDLVEDLRLGQQLAAAGHPAMLVEQATVWSDAESSANTLSQRRRWEGGFLANALRVGPMMIGRSVRRLDPRSLWAAVDTMIPPLALLFLIDFAALILAGLWIWLAGAASWPAVFLAGTLLLAGVAIFCSWLAGGSRFVRLSGLVRIPFYVAWKIPMYLGFAREGPPKNWVRTSRD
jgi:cellulose synthase/poly-beta-1,6-N-acetylglucosamine synthase-like glycosyltransferase